MSRYVDTFIKLYEIYYNKIYNNIIYEHRIKYKNIYNDNIYKKLNNIISAFDCDHIFDNYCCCCLNYKTNDLFIKLKCGHEMHYYCFNNFIKLKHNQCPFCKKIINENNNENVENNNKIYKYEINELYYNI